MEIPPVLHATRPARLPPRFRLIPPDFPIPRPHQQPRLPVRNYRSHCRLRARKTRQQFLRTLIRRTRPLRQGPVSVEFAFASSLMSVWWLAFALAWVRLPQLPLPPFFADASVWRPTLLQHPAMTASLSTFSMSNSNSGLDEPATKEPPALAMPHCAVRVWGDQDRHKRRFSRAATIPEITQSWRRAAEVAGPPRTRRVIATQPGTAEPRHTPTKVPRHTAARLSWNDHSAHLDPAAAKSASSPDTKARARRPFHLAN